MEQLNFDAWRNKTCADCKFQERAPRNPKEPVDLKAPKVIICREAPPVPIFAIGQTGNGQIVPQPITSAYPFFLENNPACSRYKQRVEYGLVEQTNPNRS